MVGLPYDHLQELIQIIFAISLVLGNFPGTLTIEVLVAWYNTCRIWTEDP